MRTKTEDKRQTILKAAMRLFLKNGYEGTSVEAIAREAKCSKATVYQYFSGKEELLKEGSELEVGSDLHSAVRILKSDIAPRERLLRFGEAALRAQCSRQSVEFFRLLVYSASRSDIDLISMVKGPNEIGDSLKAFFSEVGLSIPKGLSSDDAVLVFIKLVFGDIIEFCNVGVLKEAPEDMIKQQVSHGVEAFLILFPLPDE